MASDHLNVRVLLAWDKYDTKVKILTHPQAELLNRYHNQGGDCRVKPVISGSDNMGMGSTDKGG